MTKGQKPEACSSLLPPVPTPRKKTFPHPPPCTNPGNPMFSCMLELSTLLTSSSLAKPQVSLFKTTSSEYSAIAPTAEMLPYTYIPSHGSNIFRTLTHWSPQDSYLNTTIDRSRAHDYPNLQHTL
ncbi:uncharacterized protein C15orf65 homolog [Numida meleagris]|uniref:uncharacterized protein C15orf65 homolog n=1 Tax=Numida meleagris TaxID=8996 RepID=UPI000B3E255A|nr:uncharacterized protein C15orf65 homolog [Numida meleagris]